MTHIHIPDGVLPVWLWLGGWVLTAIVVWAAGRASRRADRARTVPLLGVVSALVLVAMSIEIVPIAYHANLTVVAGVLLGPWLGLVTAFVVAFVLALLGHGGITVVGLNALLLGAEIVIGWALFRGLVSLLGRKRAGFAGAGATVLTLAVTTSLLVGLVALAGPQWVEQPTGALDPETLSISAPFEEGFFTLRGEEEEEEEHAEGGGLSIGRFAAVVFVLGPFGWALEAAVTGLVLGYVSRVRPGLLAGRPGGSGRLPGDETGEP